MSSIQDREDAKIVVASISAVQIAAAWVIESDDVWAMFRKFMISEPINSELPPDARRVQDEAIATVDVLRTQICKEFGIDPGKPYPRKFR